VRDPGGLEVQVIAQKIIAIIAITTLLFQSVQADRPSAHPNHR